MSYSLYVQKWISLFAVAIAVAAAALLTTIDAEAQITGNGFPGGSHFNLNIIGVENPKTASMTNKGGNVIFVPLSGTTKIYLQQGPFAVIDANGTDSNGACRLAPPIRPPATTCSVHRLKITSGVT